MSTKEREKAERLRPEDTRVQQKRRLTRKENGLPRQVSVSQARKQGR